MSELPSAELLKVGCVGGGQLGRMMALEAPRLNISMTFLDPLGPTSPSALAGNPVIEGKLDDEQKLQQLAKDSDVVTVEIEHVGVDGLEKLEKSGVNVQPSSRVIRLIQDKYTQKVIRNWHAFMKS
jgi:phosphoribosylaminoimidazole carboxylase (NCAIR synthetase)